MCNDNYGYGGIVFPNFTRYACCNPCCDGSVSAQRMESDNNNDCCCRGCCCCCCHCCHDRNWCDGNVGGANDNDYTPPCPCRSGW